jgi:Tfp pilus assembly protein PilF
MTKVDTPNKNESRRTPTRLATLLAFACVAVSPIAHAQLGAGLCGNVGPQPNQFGPFDYRTMPRDQRYLVESAHFTPTVELLTKGNTGSVGADLDYTLRAIPNHPRALLAMSRYATRLQNDRFPGSHYSSDCYFDRAMRMAPDDPMPHVLFAGYLRSKQKPADAKRELEQAEALRGNPASFDLDYNLGLLYFDLGEYDKAAVAAKRAYALGAPLPALRAKLKARGKSVE